MPHTDPHTTLSTTARPAVFVKFWGTRGSIPTPGPSTLRYGGDTSCVEVRAGESILMLDCGTGARQMGMALMREFPGRALDLHVFVSHTHWDHIQGFPFFAPAYIPGNRITVYSLRGADKSLEKIFTGQMDASYFPVELSDLKARLEFVELQGRVEIGPVRVSNIYVNHPGMATTFRIEVGGKSVVYTTDHEPYSLLLGDNEFNRNKDLQVTEFARGADLYIREAQYTDEEYPGKRGWGHSTWSEVLEAAQHAGVKRLALFHHEPMHDDDVLDRIVAACHARMKERGMAFECFAAADNLQIIL
jgi:phosphoribosyl 1,2-cyclic phosphodiesterase